MARNYTTPITPASKRRNMDAMSLSNGFIGYFPNYTKASNARHHPPASPPEIDDKRRVAGRVHAAVRRGLLNLPVPPAVNPGYV